MQNATTPLPSIGHSNSYGPKLKVDFNNILVCVWNMYVYIYQIESIQVRFFFLNWKNYWKRNVLYNLNHTHDLSLQPTPFL